MPYPLHPLSMAARGVAVALLGALLLAAAPAAAEGPQPDLIPVGTPAPMFESVDTEGVPFSMAESLKQGPVMLVFWSLFCASCMEELPLIEQEQPKFAGKVQIFAVNLDEAPRAKNVKQVATQKGLTFRMLLNKLEQKAADGTVTKKDFQIDQAFKITATPALYILNRDGTVAYAHYGALGPDELAEVVAKAR
jgi:peroxiredoxin